jgi:hypothetical protein
MAELTEEEREDQALAALAIAAEAAGDADLVAGRTVDLEDVLAELGE